MTLVLVFYEHDVSHLGEGRWTKAIGGKMLEVGSLDSLRALFHEAMLEDRIRLEDSWKKWQLPRNPRPISFIVEPRQRFDS